MSYRIPIVLLIACSTASAQVVNGDFETGAFPPWTTATTPGGAVGFLSVVSYDIDGPGPNPTSLAARCCVGRSSPGTGPEGITFSQPINLIAGTDYDIRADWSVWAQVNVYSAGGGIFQLLIDGNQVTQDVAPATVQGQSYYGHLWISYFAQETRPHTLAIRITRTTTFGEEVFQYLDNVRVVASCYANCDHSSVAPILNANDFQCFLSRYAASGPYANCDGTTAQPILNANDFQCFLNAYAAGCP